MIEFLSGLYVGAYLGSLVARLMTDRAWFKAAERLHGEIYAGGCRRLERGELGAAQTAAAGLATLDILVDEQRKRWWAR